MANQEDRDYLPELLRDVNLNNSEGPIYLVGRSYGDVQNCVREYEIENTVSFVKTRKMAECFGQNSGELVKIPDPFSPAMSIS